jgi:hypothetical protein
MIGLSVGFLSQKKVVVAVSTVNGCYFLESDEERRNWSTSGPHIPGESVNSVCYNWYNDALYAATHTDGVFVSKDNGKTWRPSNRGLHVRKTWTIGVDPHNVGRLYVGTQYGHMFRSDDNGGSWNEVTSLYKAPYRMEWGIDWAMGTLGLAIHTIKFDPSQQGRFYIIASGNGVYRTDDNGESWKPLRSGLLDSCPAFTQRSLASADTNPQPESLSSHLNEVHRCAHKVALSRTDTSTLYQQNHCGVYYSSDAGGRWEDRSSSNQSRHGFGIIAVNDVVYTVPAYQGICDKHNSCIKGSLEVYRGKDGARKWEILGNGLPTGVHTCVLRDALTTDYLKTAGVYFGTTTGQVFGTADYGNTWNQLLDGVGRIQGVDCFVVD